MQFQWSGFIMPIPGYLPDNSDQWTQYFINLIDSTLPPSFDSLRIVVDPVAANGTQTLHVTGNYSGSTDPQIILTNAVSGAGTNLDLGSVQFSSDSLIGGNGAIPFTGGTLPVFQPPVSILGNPSLSPDGRVSLPMTIDYSAPNAPPIPVVVTSYPAKTTTAIPSSPRGGTIPVRGTTTILDNSGGDTSNVPPVVVPVVVTTTPGVPIPTQPTPQLPMPPLNNPIYVPAQQVAVTVPGIPPPSPDPASTIVSGTPIQTPHLPPPTTTISVPVPTTDTINILGHQVSKTFAIIAVIGIGYFLLSGSSKR